jgi:hypothetical protein
MSLVKKNRIDHFRKNKQNTKKREKEQGAKLRAITAHEKVLDKVGKSG